MRYTIIMGDVIGSSRRDPAQVAAALGDLVARANQACAQQILSPLTITLGDEFQGVAADLAAALQLVDHLNEHILRRALEVELRYVIHQGEIDTEINRETSYGMLGPGLTHARQLLTDKTGRRDRVQFALEDERSGRLLALVHRILDQMWDEPALRRSPAVFADLLYRGMTDSEAADEHGRNRSQIWKYRRNWKMDGYVAARKIITEGLYA